MSKSWRLFICSLEGPNKEVKAKKPSITICSRFSYFWARFTGLIVSIVDSKENLQILSDTVETKNEEFSANCLWMEIK